jgi:exodeoxyribonuclease VII small subunit
VAVAESSGEGAASPFEGSMKRLSEIVTTLERGELPLEDTIALFEEGVRLAAAAQSRLDAAQKRVEELLSVDESGRPRTAPFALREE